MILYHINCKKKTLLSDIIIEKKGKLNMDKTIMVGSINSIFYFLHKAAEPFNCLEQDNLA